MGWAYGIIDGREVGYGVEAVCDRDGCEAEIDRGVAYRCGGPDFDAGCGGYFCSAHVFYITMSKVPQMCGPCCDEWEREQGEGAAMSDPVEELAKAVYDTTAPLVREHRSETAATTVAVSLHRLERLHDLALDALADADAPSEPVRCDREGNAVSDDIRRWQARIAEWHRHRWGEASLPLVGLKLAEETGEACEAIVKVHEGHPRAAEMDLGHELADVVIVAMVAADAAGLCLRDEIRRRASALPGWPTKGSAPLSADGAYQAALAALEPETPHA